MEFKKLNISNLNPSEYNPRVGLEPGDMDYEKLKQSIQKFGHVQPIVWNETTGNIVGGHQSVKVLQELGETEVDCIVINMDIQNEKALNIALNKISGRWDIDKLAAIIDELVEEGLAEFTGFGEKEIERITQQCEDAIQELGEIDTNDFSEESFSNKCPRCGFLY